MSVLPSPQLALGIADDKAKHKRRHLAGQYKGCLLPNHLVRVLLSVFQMGQHQLLLYFLREWEKQVLALNGDLAKERILRNEMFVELDNLKNAHILNDNLAKERILRNEMSVELKFEECPYHRD
ncbi:hypothetical protein BUALT_Bualt19G0073600 [Buddleja alternifolia]|uniref:Uncharacterized protein n=1 Tax=Buddleja alternifolia TaxID=168488 RepID=A0AAV6WAB5_9LAMI|nr:hypothetical protein BUALT_Bualt19G0073600 [Buddleja alternifolia]